MGKHQQLKTSNNQIEWRSTEEIERYARNARTHSAAQIRQIAASIERFGFTNPVLIGDDGGIIAGHGRVRAAKQLGMAEVPTLRLSHLSDAERRAYVIADNKLAEKAGWDEDLLALELLDLEALGFDLELTGFEIAEIDTLLLDASETVPPDELDQLPAASEVKARCASGDLWALGPHRLLCGDALNPADVTRLVGQAQIDLIFTDPPYNVPVNGHVTGKGRNKHAEFAFASGEMSSSEFEAFLEKALSNGALQCKDGAIAFVCMD